MDTTLLGSGIYSVPQAAMLLDVPVSRVRGWVSGSHGARPLIRSELPRAGRQLALSFVNLIEAKFIATFAAKGVSVLSMRYMAEEAARFLGHSHPFATDWIFKTDGRRIFVEAAERAGDPCLYDLKGHNFAMHAIMAQEFKSDVSFSASGLANAWKPRTTIAPSVMLRPKVAFGAPALEKSGVPTEAIYAAFVAEGRDSRVVAKWFDVSADEVKEAVAFEEAVTSCH